MGMVGEGAYGLVMKCREVASGQLVAIKEFKVEDSDPDAKEVRRTGERETGVVAACSAMANDLLHAKTLLRRLQLPPPHPPSFA